MKVKMLVCNTNGTGVAETEIEANNTKEIDDILGFTGQRIYKIISMDGVPTPTPNAEPVDVISIPTAPQGNTSTIDEQVPETASNSITHTCITPTPITKRPIPAANPKIQPTPVSKPQGVELAFDTLPKKVIEFTEGDASYRVEDGVVYKKNWVTTDKDVRIVQVDEEGNFKKLVGTKSYRVQKLEWVLIK